MFAARPIEAVAGTIMTLPIFSFGLPNEGRASTVWLKVGYASGPAAFGDGDAFETVTWTSNYNEGLVIGLGGTPVDGHWPPVDPHPRTSFTPPLPETVTIPAMGDLSLPYALWVGPALLTLTANSDGTMTCTFEDGSETLTDTFPGTPGGYAAIETSTVAVGANLQTGAVYLGEWKASGAPTPDTPYPFPPGLIVPGPGSTGAIPAAAGH